MGQPKDTPYSHSISRPQRYARASHHDAGFASGAGFIAPHYEPDAMFGQGGTRWAPTMSTDGTRMIPHHRPRSVTAHAYSFHHDPGYIGASDPAFLPLSSHSLGPAQSIFYAPYPNIAASLHGASPYLQAGTSFGDFSSYSPASLPFLSGANHGSIAARMASNSMPVSQSGATSPSDLMAENYIASIPHPSESSVVSPSSLSETPRSLMASPASSSPPPHEPYGAPSAQDVGPFRSRNDHTLPFARFHNLKTLKANGHVVVPEIQAQVVKNVFFHDHVWTCYRRNYISVECSYTLEPCFDNIRLYLHDEGRDRPVQVQSLAVSLLAAVDKAEGKTIELVQHTPKRDRGPQFPIRIEKLSPAPRGLPNTGYSTSTAPSPLLPLQCEEEDATPNVTSPNPKQCQHTFERVQFKQATANNGRRRAQQQYYHLIVALYADVRDPKDAAPKWEKVAEQLSEAMVVRGRSPGHYSHEENRGESSGGPGGGASGRGSGSARQYGYVSGEPSSSPAQGSTSSYPNTAQRGTTRGSNAGPMRRASRVSPLSTLPTSTPALATATRTDGATLGSQYEDFSTFASGLGCGFPHSPTFDLALPRRDLLASELLNDPRDLFIEETASVGTNETCRAANCSRFECLEGDRRYGHDPSYDLDRSYGQDRGYSYDVGGTF